MKYRIAIPSIIIASSASLLIAGMANKPETEIFPANAASNDLVITSDMLQATELVDFQIPDNGGDGSLKNDRKFKIDLGNERYILGAIVFNDCDHQFVGKTLGDAFGIDLLEQDDTGVLNFHLILSFQNISWASISYTMKLSQSNDSDASPESPVFGVKSKTFETKPTTEEAFYDELYRAGYYNLLHDSQGSNRYYNYVNRSYTEDDELHAYETKPITHAQGLEGDRNLLAFQFNSALYNPISAQRKMEFTINLMTFRNSCD